MSNIEGSMRRLSYKKGKSPCWRRFLRRNMTGAYITDENKRLLQNSRRVCLC